MAAPSVAAVPAAAAVTRVAAPFVAAVPAAAAVTQVAAPSVAAVPAVPAVTLWLPLLWLLHSSRSGFSLLSQPCELLDDIFSEIT